MTINDTLDKRGGVHGDFAANAKIMQATKRLWRDHVGWQHLDDTKREALDLIAVKVGRVLCGDPSFADHWHDIAGYAILAERSCDRE